MIKLMLSGGLLALLPFTPLPRESGAPAPANGAAPFTAGECDGTAEAMRQAGLARATADYLTAVSTCVNHGGTFSGCGQKLRWEYRQAQELVEEQYQARLQVCQLLGGGRYDPDLDPLEFGTTINNSYLPLVPGRTLVYEKLTAEGLERIEVTTTPDTVVIDDVECVVVRDTVTLNGVLIEDTDDWFAQHQDGDVWYFGEISRNYEDGMLDNVDGSWRAGKLGAEPGIKMKGMPQPGDAYRQEFFLGEAEDLGMVISTGETVTVPYGTFTNCVQTEDLTPLEPDHRERKFYAPGIGLVLEVDPDSGERTELVDVTP